MKAYARVVTEYTTRRLAGWSPNEPFDLAAEMNELALEIIAKIVFGVDLSEQASKLRDAVHVFRAGHATGDEQPDPSARLAPFAGKIASRRALRVVDQLIWNLIRERRASAEAGNDILGQMLAAAGRMESRFLSRIAEIRDEAATLFVAGHDTTSASLAWLWFLLRSTRKWNAGLSARRRRSGLGLPVLKICQILSTWK